MRWMEREMDECEMDEREMDECEWIKQTCGDKMYIALYDRINNFGFELHYSDYNKHHNKHCNEHRNKHHKKRYNNNKNNNNKII